MTNALPERIEDEDELERLLSEPSDAAVEALRRVPGDVMLLGVGGKMGLSLAQMARRAADVAETDRRIVGVSRFSDPAVERALNECGVETIRGDLLDSEFVDALPDAPNVIHMTGMKFGTSGRPSATWATNVYMPTLVCRRFARSRIVAFSTGNVYPLVPIESGGSKETHPCAPVGEYAMTALGRERMFEHFSHTRGIPVALVRLNYAVEMRYGVLVDVAQRVWTGKEIDVGMGFVNVIWQGDACAMTLAALADAATPPRVINVAGAEILSVRDVAEEFGRLLDKPARCSGTEGDTALLSDGHFGHERYGSPRVDAAQLMRWIAEWVRHGGRTLERPTHFEVRDGGF
jgi:nucleoside-diphosphate-sugar epimerase